jgi:hypothetical protein
VNAILKLRKDCPIYSHQTAETNRVLTEYLKERERYVTGEWRQLLNEVSGNMHFTSDITRVIKSLRRWQGMQHA